MRELISSTMRFYAAAAMFGVEQAQNTLAAPGDTEAALAKVRQALDAVSDALASKLDDPKREALEGMTRANDEMLDTAAGAMNLDMAGEFVRKTSESLSGALGGKTAPAA